MMTGPIDPNLIAESNSAREALLRTDYEHIAGPLQHRGIEVDAITARVRNLGHAHFARRDTLCSPTRSTL